MELSHSDSENQKKLFLLYRTPNAVFNLFEIPSTEENNLFSGPTLLHKFHVSDRKCLILYSKKPQDIEEIITKANFMIKSSKYNQFVRFTRHESLKCLEIRLSWDQVMLKLEKHQPFFRFLKYQNEISYSTEANERIIAKSEIIYSEKHSPLILLSSVVNKILNYTMVSSRLESSLKSNPKFYRHGNFFLYKTNFLGGGPIMNIKAIIKAETFVIIYQFSLESTGKKHLIHAKDQEQVKSYMNKLHKEIDGNLIMNLNGDITYNVKIRLFMETEREVETTFEYYLELFKRCLIDIFNLIKAEKYSIPNIKYTDEIKELNDEEFAIESDLIRKIMGVVLILFKNLFHVKPIHIKDTKCFRYTFSSHNKSQNFYKSFITNILEVITELCNQNIFLLNCRFPLDQFSWHQNKIAYKYEKPLCKVFTLKFPGSNYMSTVLRNLTTDLLEQMSCAVSKSFSLNYNPFFYNHVMHSLEKPIVETRLNLYLKNRHEFFVEYTGIMQIENSDYLLAEFSLNTNFRLDLMQIEKSLLQVVVEFTEALEAVLLKNTRFCAFDLDCLKFTEREKIQMIIKSPEEVHEDYKAPEVILGRMHRKSLMYSTGKAIKEWFLFKEEIIPKPLENILNRCIEEKPLNRPSITAIRDCAMALIN